MTDPKFWKDLYIDLNEFKEIGDNGDIILFKSKKYATKLQRAVTNSQYDHVGMIVLCETDKEMNTMFLLEAVSDDGVRLVEFLPNLEAYYEVYEKIAYRPLQNMERTESLLIDLDNYLDEVIGKKYEVSLKKFWRNSVNLKSTEGRSICDTNRTFQ